MTRILFFGRLRDAAGRAEISSELPSSLGTIADVRRWLEQQDPVLGEALRAPGVRVAIDQVFCLDESQNAQKAREIAFMSPLSGG